MNNTATLTPSPGNYFGTELDYDYGFNRPQMNGNIAGAKWKSAGDGYERAFGYSYDNANRIIKADFTQNNSGSWNNTLGSGTIDLSVSNLTYDANYKIGLIHLNAGMLCQMLHYLLCFNKICRWQIRELNEKSR